MVIQTILLEYVLLGNSIVSCSGPSSNTQSWTEPYRSSSTQTLSQTNK